MGTPFAHLKPNLITSRERIHELDTQTESTVHLAWRTTMPLVLTQVSQGDTTLFSGRQHLQLNRAAFDTVGMLDPGCATAWTMTSGSGWWTSPGGSPDWLCGRHDRCCRKRSITGCERNCPPSSAVSRIAG